MEGTSGGKFVEKALTDRGWRFRDPNYIPNIVTCLGDDQPSDLLESAVESELLKRTLSSFGAKYLPDTSELGSITHLETPTVLEISSFKDVTIKSSGKRVFKMVLTDGMMTQIEANISPIPVTANSNDFTAGTKVRLNKAVIRGGKVRLTLKDVTVLRGSTEERQKKRKGESLVESSIKRPKRDKAEISGADGNDKNLQRNPADSVKAEDQEKPISSDTRRKQEKEIEKMRLILGKSKPKRGELSQILLSGADLPADWMVDLLNKMISISWKNKRSDLIARRYKQRKDECWAIAFSGGIYAKYMLHSRKNPPTPSDLIRRIQRRHLDERNAITYSKNAVGFLKRDYGIDLNIYYRPSLDSKDFEEQNEKFEILIESLLAISPVSVCMAYVPGYAEYKHDKDVFRPNDIDRAAMRNKKKKKKLDEHCVTLYAHGAFFKDNTCVQFWEGQDDQHPGGYVRFERYQGLITEVYEFEFEVEEVDERKKKKRTLVEADG